MALDQVNNFGKSTVSTGYDASATSIVVSDGSRFPDPASGAYNIVWWNSTDYFDPSDDPNREIVRATAKSSNTLTVTRAQESTSASTKNASGKTYTMILAPTAKMITDINTLLFTRTVGPGSSTDNAVVRFDGTGGYTVQNSAVTIDDSGVMAGASISGASNTITNVPISTGVSGLGTGVATFLGTPSSANLASAVTDETGSGSLVFGTSPSLTTPKVVTSINDTNGNELMKVTATSSAVNEVTLANAATGGTPAISATGDDTNINIDINSKGSGVIRLNQAGGDVEVGGGTTATSLKFMEPSGSGTNYTAIKAQAQTGNVTYTLPAADGTNGYVLSTNGSGTLSWVAQSGGGGGGSPGGSNTQLQYNNAGAFGGITGATSDGTSLTALDANFKIADDSDNTKIAQFQASGITTGTTRTFTFPDASTTLVGTGVTQTLTNKTLDNTNTVTLKDTLFTLQDDGDTTKQAVFQLSGITTGTTRTLTVPDASTTIVGTDATQTLSNKTLGNTTVLTIKDTSFVVQDNGDTTKQLQLELSGITTATTRTLTVPDANTTIVGTDATQTLSNKTLTAPKFADLDYIADANGNEQIILDTVASAVNEITLANAATGNDPTTSATGGDANIGHQFIPKGTGSFYGVQETIIVAISDETTAITTGTAKVTFHMPYDFKLMKVKAGLSTASSSGNPTFDVNDDGVSVFSTTVTIDANETFSDTAATPPVLTSTPLAIASGSVMTIDVDTAGTGAKGAKLYLIGYSTAKP